ncbi:MAG: ATP-binding protein [Chloroflexota bacterium]
MKLVRQARASLTSLRGRLLLLVVLAAVPLFGLAFYSYLEQRNRATSQAQAEALRLARLAASDQRGVIEDARLVLITLSALPEVRGGDPDACSQAVTRLRDSIGSFQSLGVIDQTGTIVCSALPEAIGVNVSDRTYVQRAIATQRFAVGDYQVGRASRTSNLNFGYPILANDGTVRAVAYASLNLDWLNEYAAEARLPAGGALTVLDASGTILARYPDPDAWVGRPGFGSPTANILLNRLAEATAEITDLDGRRRLVAIVPLARATEGQLGNLMVGIPADQAYASAERDLLRDLVVLTVLGIIVLGVAGFGAERHIVRPVYALASAARRLRMGDFTARTGLKAGTNEIRQLATDFDEMAAALQAAEARRAEEEALRRHNAELEQQNQATREANRLKSEFLSMVSHEMRTPLTSIQGYADLLLEEGSGALGVEQRQFLRIMRENSDHLVRLISDLLDLARIEAGRLELRLAPLDVDDVIQTVAATMRPLLAEKSQTLHLDLPADLPPVLADRARLVQILTNLLSNANKYTTAGGNIVISVRTEARTVTVDVRDDGIGMTDEEQRQVFTPFFRSDHPEARQTGGTGLGLAITRSLVQTHGGEMRFVSQPGSGSTFSVSLPLVPGEPLAASAEAAG